MNYLVLSDIHGGALQAQQALSFFDKFKCDYLVLLGDLLNHGPRNGVPKDYDPMQVGEVLNQYKENTDYTSGLRKFFNRKNRWPLYGYWFYVVIKVNHPCFSEINMRINKYIVNEINQIQYLSCVRYAQDIVDILSDLAELNKKQQ